jgi:hypothetical protein
MAEGSLSTGSSGALCLLVADGDFFAEAQCCERGAEARPTRGTDHDVVDVRFLNHEVHGDDHGVPRDGSSGNGIRSPDHAWLEFGDLLAKEV